MNTLKVLLAVTIAEAISWLGLLGTMVAKYGFDSPRGVEILGPVHGTLFVVFVGVLLLTHLQLQWPIRKTVISFLESIPPFTGFVLARQLAGDLSRSESQSRSGSQAAA
jgi:integral membrane protein